MLLIVKYLNQIIVKVESLSKMNFNFSLNALSSEQLKILVIDVNIPKTSTMNNIVNATSLTNIQLLFACRHINALVILFNNDHLVPTHEKNRTEPTLNALFQYLSESNESDAKFRLLQKSIKGTSFYRVGKVPKTGEKRTNETYWHIMNWALFSFYKNIAQLLNKTEKNVIDFKETVFQYLLKRTVKHDCSFESFSSKFTAKTISKIYYYILKLFIESENLERNLNQQRKKLQILKRFKRQTGGKGLSETIEADNGNVSLRELKQATDDFDVADIDAFLNNQNSNNDYGNNIENNASDIDNEDESRTSDFQNNDDDNDMLMDAPAGFEEALALPEDIGINSHDDNDGAGFKETLALPEDGEQKFYQALRLLANGKYGDDFTPEDVLETFINIHNSNDNVSENIENNAFSADNILDRLIRHSLDHGKGPLPKATASDFKRILTGQESPYVANIQRIDTGNDRPQRTMGNEDTNIGFSGTSKETTSTFSDVSEPHSKKKKMRN